MTRRTVRYGALLVTGTMLAGCATIINHPSQKVPISSEPSGATVNVDGKSYGTTPLSAKLKRNKTHELRIELAGYQPFTATLTPHLSGWVFGNILLGGLIGLAVDAVTGSMYALRPEEITTTLQRQDQASLPLEEGLYVTLVRKPDPSWRRIGQLEAID